MIKPPASLALAAAVVALVMSTLASAQGSENYVNTPFQVTSLRRTPEAGALETEPDIAGTGDTLVAVWSDLASGGCRHNVGWATSLDGGSSWTYGGNVPSASPGFAMPSICSLGAGEFLLASLTCAPSLNVNVQRGVLGATGLTWVSSTRVDDNPGGIALFWPDIIANGASVYVCYTRIHNTSPRVVDYSDVQFVRSADGGVTWSAPVVLTSSQSQGGRLAVGPDGEVYVVWRDHAQESIVVRRSDDRGSTFGPEFVVGPITSAQGGMPPAWLPHIDDSRYTTAVDCIVADRPQIAVDVTGSNRGQVYVAWTEGASGMLSPTSGHQGEVEPNDSYGSANTVQIGQTLSGSIPSGDLGGSDPGDVWAFQGTAGTTISIGGELSSTRKGNDLLPFFIESLANGHVVPIDRCNYLGQGYQTLPFTFTLPATGTYYLRTTGSGPDAQSYTFAVQEMQLTSSAVARDHRDVVIVRSLDGGMTWSGKVRVNDDLPQYDNALPALAVDSLGRVHVAWFDRRHATDPGASSVHTRWAYSNDGGQTFSNSRALSTVPSEYAQFDDEWRIGSYQSLVVNGERVYGVWSQMVSYADADVYGAEIKPDGITSVLLSGLSASRVQSGVRLEWEIGDRNRIAVIDVYRRADGDPEILVAQGLSLEGGGSHHAWIDDDTDSGHRYTYRLRATTTSGEGHWSEPVSIEIEPRGTRLSVVGPNPFRTAIALNLLAGRGERVDVGVYDVAGKRIRMLFDGTTRVGVETIIWDARDDHGRVVPIGLYLLHARVGTERLIARVAYIR